ncbi:MAG TPA: hypothetical protein VGM10_04695 [Actinocrinis sp.]|jgi:hypothetical protein
MSIRSTIRKRRRTVIRKVRRAVRRRVRKTVHRTARHVRTSIRRYRARRAERRVEIRRTAAACAAGAPIPRSLTGKPRPLRNAPPAYRPTPEAPIEQRVKRGPGGKFNGSTSAGKRAAAKKTAAKKTAAARITPEQRAAARALRTLAVGDKRAARVDKRTRS